MRSPEQNAEHARGFLTFFLFLVIAIDYVVTTICIFIEK